MSAPSIAFPAATFPRTRVLIAFGGLLIALGTFNGALSELLRRWDTQPEYSHGYVIPLVSAWLLWKRLGAARTSVGQPAWAGAILILAAMLMHLLGELSAIFILSQFAFVVALLGLALGVGGLLLFRTALVPISFLIFAIPLPYVIHASLSLRLQLMSSDLGALFAELFQIPVYVDGNIIDLGTYKLQVVDACSGLRYLFPLLSLSFLAAYLFRAPHWQRALVILSAIPITLGINGVRIGIVCITVDRWGPRMADDLLHLFEGWIIFAVAALLLIAELWLLAWMSGREFLASFDVPVLTPPLFTDSKISQSAQMPALTCLLLLSATGLFGALVSGRSEIVPDRKQFVTFPEVLGDWKGHPLLLDAETEHVLALQDYILSDYESSDGRSVNLYVAYYASQRTGESPHSPLFCIPGSGWLITNLERTSYVDLEHAQPVNRAVIERNGVKQIVYYWYDERGRMMASEYWSKWYLLLDAITKNRSDGALVRLITTVLPGEAEGTAEGRLKGFMRDLLPRLSDYVPPDAPPHNRAPST